MLKLSSGFSDKDRISFYTSNGGATAFWGKNRKVNVNYNNENDPYMRGIIYTLGIFYTLSLVKLFLLIPLVENKIIGTVWYLFPAFFYSFLAISSIISLRKTDGKEFLRNHGAEHKIIKAYNKLGRIPTVQEVNKFSRIDTSCGITIYSAFITAQLIGFIVYKSTNYIIPEILLFIIPLFFKKFFPFNLLGMLAQFFTTSKPKQHNIELGIAALQELECRELLDNDMLLDTFSNVFEN